MSSMKRPNRDEYWLKILDGIKARGTCPRRKTSAIIVDSDNNLISSGYNGSPRHTDHCIDIPCGGQDDVSGDTSRCIAIHAEQNALLQAGDRLRYASTIYCSTRPCFICAKLICQTNIKRVVYLEAYPDHRTIQLFNKCNIEQSLVEL